MCISCVGTSAPKRIAFAATCLLLVLPSLAAQTPNFASRRDYYLGGFPQVVALGDFNGDGILDFVTEQERVYFGNGDGTFRQGPMATCCASVNCCSRLRARRVFTRSTSSLVGGSVTIPLSVSPMILRTSSMD